MVNGLLIFALIAFVVVYWRWPVIQNRLWQKKYQDYRLDEKQKTLLLRYMPIYQKMTDADREKIRASYCLVSK